jgi:hypothetical protein
MKKRHAQVGFPAFDTRKRPRTPNTGLPFLQLQPGRRFLISYYPLVKNVQSPDSDTHLFLHANESDFEHDKGSVNQSFRITRVGGSTFQRHGIVDLLLALNGATAANQSNSILLVGDSTTRLF